MAGSGSGQGQKRLVSFQGVAGRRAAGRGAATRPPPPAPSGGGGSCTHRSPLSPAPGAQPRGLGPAAKRVSGPVSRAGLRDARAARSINNPPLGDSGCFPVTPGARRGRRRRAMETIKPPAGLPSLPPPSTPRSSDHLANAAREWEGPSRTGVLPSWRDTRGSGPNGDYFHWGETRKGRELAKNLEKESLNLLPD